MPTISRQTLTMERTTKGAILYTTEKELQGNGGPVTSIYLRKEFMPTQNYPGTITVTVETEEDIS